MAMDTKIGNRKQRLRIRSTKFKPEPRAPNSGDKPLHHLLMNQKRLYQPASIPIIDITISITIHHLSITRAINKQRRGYNLHAQVVICWYAQGTSLPPMYIFSGN